MKNVQVIDGAMNCTYDIFAIDDPDFLVIFPDGQDIEFASDLWERSSSRELKRLLDKMWSQRVEKEMVQGIHGTLFYELDFKKQYYPTKKSAEMVAAI
ncbi:hypothetical protein [Devosia sp. CAU 1758]